MNSAISAIDNIDLAGTGVLVFDGANPNAKDLLFDNLKLLNRGELRHPTYEKLNIGGRTLLVGVQLAPGLVGPNGISSTYWINLLMGDGFVVLVLQAGSTEELEGMAWKLVEACRAPFRELDKGIEISASISVASFLEHGNTCEQLLAAAENAMYAAKRAKTNPVQVSRGS